MIYIVETKPYFLADLLLESTDLHVPSFVTS
jgi:hypothetical protein